MYLTMLGSLRFTNAQRDFTSYRRFTALQCCTSGSTQLDCLHNISLPGIETVRRRKWRDESACTFIFERLRQKEVTREEGLRANGTHTHFKLLRLLPFLDGGPKPNYPKATNPRLAHLQPSIKTEASVTTKTAQTTTENNTAHSNRESSVFLKQN